MSKSAGNYPVDRLYKQYTKAKHFVSDCYHIKSPRILEWSARGGFNMEMVQGDCFFELAKKTSLVDLYKFADILFEFIKHELRQCDQYDTVNDELLAKLADIKPFLVKEDYHTICNLIESHKVQLPIGPCHGDLTFVNMVFKDKDIYLLDFLDSFINSPVMDIIKLQQDTIYMWSMFLPNVKYSKVNQWFSYLNGLLAEFSAEPWYNSQILHVVNLCRILPYSQKNDRILGYLFSCIQQSLAYCQSADNPRDLLKIDLNGF